MVTIATSPFFLDQKEAIKLIQELFEGMEGKAKHKINFNEEEKISILFCME